MLRLIFGMLLCMPLCGQANEQQLLTLEALAYKTTADASLVSLRQGDGLSRQRLQQTLIDTDKQVNELAGQWPQLADQWRSSRRFIEKNLEVAASNGDVRYPVNLDEQQQALYKAIRLAKDGNEAAADADVRAMLQTLSALEQMVAGYMYFNINVFGGLSVTDNTIEAAAQRFRQLLPSLPADINRKLQGKWQFVEKAILDYNNNSAVFIVRRTTDSMRDILTTGLSRQSISADG